MGQQNANSGIAKGGVIHGARMYLAWQGRPLGYCQGVRIGYSIDQRELRVLDDMLSPEHVAVAYRVNSFSATFVELFERSLHSMGIQEDLDAWVHGNEFTAEIKDRPNDKAKWTVEGVKFAGANFGAEPGNPTATNVDFVARVVRGVDGRV